MTTMMTMMMMVTTRTGTITPTMTVILLLSIGDCVAGSAAEDGTDAASSMVVVLEDITGVTSPGVDADIVVSIVGSVGVGRAPV